MIPVVSPRHYYPHRGVHQRIAMEILGHSDISLTMNI